jgi:hypothetical protein
MKNCFIRWNQVQDSDPLFLIFLPVEPFAEIKRKQCFNSASVIALALLQCGLTALHYNIGDVMLKNQNVSVSLFSFYIPLYLIASMRSASLPPSIVLISFLLYLYTINRTANFKICLNNNIYSYLETSGGQSSDVYLSVVHLFNTSVNYRSVVA